MKTSDEEEQMLLPSPDVRDAPSPSRRPLSTFRKNMTIVIPLTFALLMLCVLLAIPMQRMEVLSYLNFQTKTSPAEITDMSEGICTLQPSLDIASPNCQGTYVNFKVPATPDGLWPKGLSWYVVENVFDLKGVFGRMAYEGGPADDKVAGIGCTSFSKILCLQEGNYLFHASNVYSMNASAVYVDLCGPEKRVFPGSTLSFDTSSIVCPEPDFSHVVPTHTQNVTINIQEQVPIDKESQNQENLRTASKFLGDAAVLLGEKVVESTAESRKACHEWLLEYSVIPGKTWGILPEKLKASWVQNRCDLYVAAA